MFIDKNTRRWNKPYSQGTTEIAGVRYPNTVWDDLDFRTAQGITEIPDPRLPEGVTDETHYIHSLDAPPYLQWEPKSAEQVAQSKNNRIDQQIQALEQQALNQGLIRTIIEDLLMRYMEQATKAGITEAQLLDPTNPAYSRAYEKVKANADARAALRSQKA